MPIARRHTHRERGCRVRASAGQAGGDKQHSTNPEAPHYPAACKQEFRTRTPQQATAYSEGANAWRTEVRWGGRYEPGREETNTILITTQSTSLEPPTKPTMFEFVLCLIPAPHPPCHLAAQSRNREAEG